jgi:hypothetical protein
MTAEPQGTFNFPDQVKGATLPARSFLFYDGQTPPANLTTVVLKFYKDGAVTLTPSMTITSASTWAFNMNLVAGASMALEEGIHDFDIKTTDAAGTIEFFVRGTINILPSAP